VSLSGGATGRMIAATATTLTVSVKQLPPAGTTLKAAVASFGGKFGGAAPVALMVAKATVTSSTQRIHRGDRTIEIRGNNFSPVAADKTFQYSSVGITAGNYVVFTVTDSGVDEVDEVDGTTYDTSGAVITGVWSAPVDSSNLQTFTITALQDSYGYYKFSQYEPAGLISEFAVYSSSGSLIASGSATQVTT
jgi:hypothetical protein